MLYFVERRSRKRRGVAAVEAALVLPPLLMFLAAAIDLGRVGRIGDALSNAARNGAQYGSASTSAATNTAGIRAAALTEMSFLPNVSSSNPTVAATTVTNTSGSISQTSIQVTVTYSMTGTQVFPFFPITSMARTVQMPMMPQ